MIGTGEQDWYKWTISEDSKPDRVLVVINRQLFVAMTIVYIFSAHISLVDYAKVVIATLAILTSIAAILYQEKLIKNRTWLGITLTGVMTVCQIAVICLVFVMAGGDSFLLVAILVLFVVTESGNPRGLIAVIAFCASALSFKNLQAIEQVGYILCLVQMIFMLCFKVLWVALKKEKTKLSSAECKLLSRGRQLQF